MLNMKLLISNDMKSLLQQSMLPGKQLFCAFYPDIGRMPTTISSFGIQRENDWIELFQESIILEDGEYYSKLCLEKKASDSSNCYMPHNNIFWKRGNNAWIQSPIVGPPNYLFNSHLIRKDKQIFFELQGKKSISIIHDSLTFEHTAKKEIHHIEADIGILFETQEQSIIFSVCDKDFTYSKLFTHLNAIDSPLNFWSFKTDPEYCREAVRNIEKLV